MNKSYKKVSFRKHSYYWKVTVKGMTFVLHFTLVMIILFIGALALALLEDSDVFYESNDITSLETKTKLSGHNNNTFVHKSHIVRESIEHEQQSINDLASFFYKGSTISRLIKNIKTSFGLISTTTSRNCTNRTIQITNTILKRHQQEALNAIEDSSS